MTENLDVSVRLATSEIIRIKSSKPLKVESLLIKAYVPGAQIITRKQSAANITISLIDAKKPSFHQDRNHLVLADTFDDQAPMDLYHLLYCIARAKALNKELYPVHAACLRFEGFGRVLIVGHSGSGKTAITQALRTHAELFSGDKTLVQYRSKKLIARAGTPVLTANSKYLASASVRYENRSAKLVKQTSPGPINAVAIVRLNDGVSEHEQLHGRSVVHQLFPYFMDTVKNHVIVCARYVYAPRIASHAALSLAKNLDELQIPVYTISGSKRFVTQQIKAIATIAARKHKGQ